MRFTLPALAIFIVLLSACSGMSGKSPTAPDISLASSVNPAHSNRSLLGMWDVTISADWQSAEIVPIRGSEIHLNVVKMLEEKPCKDCLTVNNIKLIAANTISVDVTLKHPFPGLLKYTGFDVRGVFISKGDYAFPPSGRTIAWGSDVPRMINYDGYTSLYNPTEFPSTTPAALGYIPGKHATGGDLTATLNPFVAYKKDAPRRMFEAGGSETKTVVIQAPTGPIHFGYAVDASWYPVNKVVDPLTDFPISANCEEAYEISALVESDLSVSETSSADVKVMAYDHQGLDTIASASVFCPALFGGEESLSLSTDTGQPYALFTGTIVNNLKAPNGTYPLLVRVVDKAFGS